MLNIGRKSNAHHEREKAHHEQEKGVRLVITSNKGIMTIDGQKVKFDETPEKIPVQLLEKSPVIPNNIPPPIPIETEKK